MDDPIGFALFHAQIEGEMRATYVIPEKSGTSLSLVLVVIWFAPTADGSQNVIRGRDMAVVERAIRIERCVCLRTRRRTYVRCLHRVGDSRGVDYVSVMPNLPIRLVILSRCHGEAECGAADREDHIDCNREAEVILDHGPPSLPRHRGRRRNARLHICLLIENCEINGIKIYGLRAREVLLLRN